jgi:hypothetical protein
MRGGATSAQTVAVLSTASFWIGFDDSTVEQVGTIAICNGGAPTYGAWWKMFTGPHSAGATMFAVSPGDVISGSVNYVGGSYVLHIGDATNGLSFTRTKKCTTYRPRNSAE